MDCHPPTPFNRFSPPPPSRLFPSLLPTPNSHFHYPLLAVEQNHLTIVSQHLNTKRCASFQSGQPMHHLRCVLVGDPCVGKTALVVAYTRNGFCEQYSPTAFDNYSVTVCVDGNPLRLDLCDTAGRSEFDSIRPLSYSGASVFLLCFNVTRPSSLNSATQRWLPEIRSLSPSAPILLIGTQSDRRLITRRSETVESKAMAQLTDRLQLSSWLECSAVTQHNLKEVFDLAILQGLCHEQKLPVAGNALSIPKAKIALPEGMRKAEKKDNGSGGGVATGTTKGGTLKQNLWRLVSITKKALL